MKGKAIVGKKLVGIGGVKLSFDLFQSLIVVLVYHDRKSVVYGLQEFRGFLQVILVSGAHRSVSLDVFSGQDLFFSVCGWLDGWRGRRM